MTDEVAGQRSLFAVGESFATGPLVVPRALRIKICSLRLFGNVL
ncbi:MAG: hypothetical protein SGJ02_11895 [bacterium]|nr:hypothetical protein [bacterium]